jgi:hypothetical protein
MLSAFRGLMESVFPLGGAEKFQSDTATFCRFPGTLGDATCSGFSTCIDRLNSMRASEHHAAQEERSRALDRWYRTLENRSLRLDSPDSYHEELLRQADEMDRLGMIDWRAWRDLRVRADLAYLRSIAGKDR